MFSHDIFGEILDTFCNNNCDSSFLSGGKPTLAFFGRRPIYITKWAGYCTCCKRHRCLCAGENREGERDGVRGTNRGQVGVIAHSHCSCLTLSPTGHDYKAQGDPSTPPADSCCLSPCLASHLALFLLPHPSRLWLRSPLEFLFVTCGVLFTPVDLHSSW